MYTGFLALIIIYFAKYSLNTLHQEKSETRKYDHRSDESHNISNYLTVLKHINFPSGYNPPCLIKNKDQISAINRASSDSCKKEITELMCRNEDVSNRTYKNIYPLHIPNFCPPANKLNSTIAGQYLGKQMSI